jgi:hypothetical protein
MSRINPPFLAWNRGLLSPKALARVDLERTRLSAETFNNWLPATQGSMSIRPGTKWKGSSLRDTGAFWIEFVASAVAVAMPEITDETMRVWLGSDAHNLSLLSRPKVDTTVSLSDTGWSNASTGGNAQSIPVVDLIPTMTAATTDGVEITASSQNSNEGTGPEFSGHREAWKAGDDDNATWWQDTGIGGSTLPSWVSVDFGSVANAKAVRSYSLRAGSDASLLANMAKTWRLIGNNFDTGINATDTGQWKLEDSRTNQTGWAAGEKRTFAAQNDTGSTAWRHWRLYVTAADGDTELIIAEMELFPAPGAAQADFGGSGLNLNATSIGALARARKRVIVSDTGTEHSLDIRVERGPVVLRVGSTSGDDDYISETSLGTGYHNLAFTPEGNFWITVQSDAIVNRIVSSLNIGDSGTVEVTAPWEATNLDDIRYDQSADVVYVDCDGVRPSKIERRGTGRSWSVVDYAPNTGPFLPTRSSTAKMSVSHFFGNTTLNSDIPFFVPGHVGALMRAFHEGQSGQWRLGALDAKTDAIEVTGISDTGTANENERRIVFSVSGTWAGTIAIERSINGDDIGFKPVGAGQGVDEGSTEGGGGASSDTGTFTKTMNDPDDNLKVWYRARITSYTSGVATVTATYAGGGITGIGRITAYNSNTDVDFEVVRRFSDTGPSDNWQQGYWSTARGFPTAVALHGGRLAHAMGGSLFLSVADDYENFDDTTEGDAGPIIRTLGAGPVDTIQYLVSLLRLIIGTDGSELTLRSSSLDEPVTPSNSSAGTFSTNGSAGMRALKMDNRGIFVQRSGRRVYMIGAGSQTAFGDYEAFELSMLVPDLLKAGVVSCAVQRQPDTRLHFVLADGTVAILTYEPQEEVICWHTWSTDTGTAGAVEKTAILPAVGEDAVYYHIRRTINGATRRYLEKWALESECVGDTGLTWIMDCAKSYTDTGRTATLTDIGAHLVGERIVVWSDDTGTTPGVDRSPDVNGVQTTYLVDTGGDVGLSAAVHHAVAGLPYKATWKSAKLAYGAQAGTALAQMKRVAQMALALYQTHNNGLFFGSDTGNLDPLPRRMNGAVVSAKHIYPTLDSVAVPFPGSHDPDARLVLQGKAPRPSTVLAGIPAVQTNERV